MSFAHKHFPLSLGLHLLVMASLSACSPSPQPTLPQAAPQPTISSVHYQLGWDTDRLEAREGGGYRLTTNKGWKVELAQGYLSSYSVQLMPCKKTVGALDTGSSGRPLPVDQLQESRGLDPLKAAFWFELISHSALAGHSKTMDPSALKLPHIQTLHALSPFESEPIHMPPAAYCEVHYLVARGGREGVAPLGAPNMERLSLVISGVLTGPDGQSRPLKVESSLAHGTLRPLQADKGPWSGGEGLEVRVIRPVAQIFDELDFTKLEGQDLERALFTRLLDNTRIELSPLKSTGG